jgi:hypothetical protein
MSANGVMVNNVFASSNCRSTGFDSPHLNFCAASSAYVLIDYS